ncbi:hypothetical protein B0O99DRAFT_688417 [Bisporella sp. PMI_857]|nr:hypothetical protein B0O99DRAFT_688417 [Bisporella sp. PMI_857]
MSAPSLRHVVNQFNKIGKGRLYHLLVSPSNLHGIMKEMRIRCDETVMETSLNLGGIRDDLKLPKDQKPPEDVDFAATMGVALSIAGSAMSFMINPPIALVTGAGGIATLLSKLKNDDNKPQSFLDKGDQVLVNMVSGISRSGHKLIDMLVSALYGLQGHWQEDILQNMERR